MRRDDLCKWFDGKLKLSDFATDVSNNGLQVEGKDEVRKAVFAVDASLRLFELAAERNADFVFVHHGLSWGSEPRRLTGIAAGRYRELFARGLSLYAAHLPLDAAPGFGNNAVLSRMIGLEKLEPFFNYRGVDIGFCGTLPAPKTAAELKKVYDEALGGDAPLLGDAAKVCRKVAVVSGGGGLESLEEAISCGADLLVTGELGHTMYHYALESRADVLALGHYLSETTGPRALMELAAAELKLETEFIDLPTGL